MAHFYEKKGARPWSVLLVLVLSLSIVLPGCASRGGRTYTDGEVRQAQTLEYGTVRDVSEVMVDQDPSLLGAGMGGVIGGVLGSLIGSGTGRVLATVGGAALGALGGAAVEKGVRKYKASQITVETDKGQYLVIVQGNDEYFVRGDRVRILMMQDTGNARVQHLN